MENHKHETEGRSAGSLRDALVNLWPCDDVLVNEPWAWYLLTAPVADLLAALEAVEKGDG